MKKSKKIKLIHLQVLPILSGVQKAMYDTLIRLDRETYDISVLCQSEGKLTDELKKQNIKYITVPELKREINPFFDLYALFKIYNLFRKEHYDIVHTHSSKPGIIGRLAAKLAGIKVIVHTVHGFAFHESSPKLSILIYGLLEKLVGYATDLVIFVNNKDRLTALKMKLLPAKKTITIFNGVDLAIYNNNNGSIKAKQLIGIEKNGHPFIGMVTRLWEQKAPEDFIRAIPFVVKNIPKAKFLVIGDGPLREKLEQISTALNIQQNVIFLGWRKDVKDLLKIMDIFVLPSLWEGLPISILEAMANAKPVIASNIKGNNELVIHGETGLLVPIQSPQKIGESVLQLLGDSSLLNKMGQNGYQVVKMKYDINKIVQQINSEYQSILSLK